jgi:hypothetical protein
MAILSKLRRQARPIFRPARRVAFLAVELLENRTVPSAVAPTITLDPGNDEFGSQIQTVTQLGDTNRVTLGILDTGASPITISPDDQAGFANPQGGSDPLPIKNPGGASGDGIGGGVTGDVSAPITVLTDGLHAANVNIDYNTLNMSATGNFGPTSARVTGIQAFVGTTAGSPDIPTISGTPIFAGTFNSSSHSKLAAKVDLINGVDLYGVGLLEPDVHFVPATTRLVPGTGELMATIPLARIGDNTVPQPGTDISSNYNFVSNSVQLNNTASNQLYSLKEQHFLLDTGSQMTVISTAEAKALHIDLSKPIDSIGVQGVGGTETVNGYVIDSLQVGVVGAGPLTFKNVPVFVLDAAVGIDGILGMNLWNNADQLLINPFTPFGATSVPTLTLTWDPNYTGSANTGGFGFKINELLAGHAGPFTLDRYLGGASQDFHVPLQVQAAPEVSGTLPAATLGLVNETIAANTRALTLTPAPATLAASDRGATETLSADPRPRGFAEIAVTGSAPTVAALEMNVPSNDRAAKPLEATKPAAAHTRLVPENSAETIFGLFAEGGSRTGDGKSKIFYPKADVVSPSLSRLHMFVVEQTCGDMPSGRAGAEAISMVAPAPIGSKTPLAEAALLAALTLVIRDYWRLEIDEFADCGRCQDAKALALRRSGLRPRPAPSV